MSRTPPRSAIGHPPAPAQAPLLPAHHRRGRPRSRALPYPDAAAGCRRSPSAHRARQQRREWSEGGSHTLLIAGLHSEQGRDGADNTDGFAGLEKGPGPSPRARAMRSASSRAASAARSRSLSRSWWRSASTAASASAS